MGYLIVKYGGIELPVRITKLDRNLTPQLNHNTMTLGNSNGVMLLSSAYAESTISIEYSINNHTAKDLSQFRRKMSKILGSKELKQLIFSDEPDIYYDAIITGGQALNEEFLRSEGTLNFLVPDSIGHSVYTKQFPAKLNANGILEATIINEGTADTPVNYTIKHNHDNGYIGIVSEYGVLQTGRVTEADLAPYKGNEVLINTETWSEFEHGTDLHPGHPGGGTANGSLKLSSLNGENVLILSDPGTGEGLHGGLVTADIPIDSDGKVGAVNFDCRFDVFFEGLAASQTGLMSISFLDENGGLIFCWVYKKDTNGVHAPINMYVGGNHMQDFYGEYSVIRLYDNETDAPIRKSFGVLKEGSRITGYYGGFGKNIDVPQLENVVCDKIQVFIGQYGSRPMVSRASFRNIRFQKMGVKLWADVPNRYPAGSTVNIDGREGKIYTDGVLRMDDEVKGAKYFHAPPGETKIQFYYSDFSVPRPNITAEIREGWL